MTSVNEFGQPVGDPLGYWTAPPFPPPHDLEGTHVLLRRLDADRDAPGLHAAFRRAPDSLWTYMTFGPFNDEAALAETLRAFVQSTDWLPYVIDEGGRPQGFASYLRIAPREGVIELGAITLAPSLQRTTAATEALYLMIRNVFDLGYRRCEWKCDHLNEPSRSAAVRLGFSHEGTFRNAMHYKGRNRDTAWYSIVDHEWPQLDEAFRRWLDPANFDDNGCQIRSLGEMRDTT